MLSTTSTFNHYVAPQYHGHGCIGSCPCQHHICPCQRRYPCSYGYTTSTINVSNVAPGTYIN